MSGASDRRNNSNSCNRRKGESLIRVECDVDELLSMQSVNSCSDGFIEGTR